MSLGCLYACCIPGTGIKQVIVCHVIVCEWRLIAMAVTFFKINCRVHLLLAFGECRQIRGWAVMYSSRKDFIKRLHFKTIQDGPQD